MPRLLRLPNETLLQIIASTHVEDIESFSSCNKHIRLLFGPVLQLHMERKKRYSKIELGRPLTRVRSPHAFMLLREVLENPAITHYPTEIVIGDCVEGIGNWPDWSEERREEGRAEVSAAITQCTALLSAKLDGCPYIRVSNKLDWKLEMCAGNERTTVAFLVTLFPNLKSITVSEAMFYPDSLVEVVSRIAVAHLEFLESSHPLQKLNTVRLERSCHIWEAWYDIFEPFAKLQSVRTLTGRMVYGWECDWDSDDENESDDEDEGESEHADEDALEDEDQRADKDDGEDEDENEDEYEYQAAELGGGITRLNFKDSAIDAQSFNTVLRGTPALRKFGYNYISCNPFEGNIKWEPAAILRSLLFRSQPDFP